MRWWQVRGTVVVAGMAAALAVPYLGFLGFPVLALTLLLPLAVPVLVDRIEGRWWARWGLIGLVSALSVNAMGLFRTGLGSPLFAAVPPLLSLALLARQRPERRDLLGALVAAASIGTATLLTTRLWGSASNTGVWLLNAAFVVSLAAVAGVWRLRVWGLAAAILTFLLCAAALALELVTTAPRCGHAGWQHLHIFNDYLHGLLAVTALLAIASALYARPLWRRLRGTAR